MPDESNESPIDQQNDATNDVESSDQAMIREKLVIDCTEENEGLSFQMLEVDPLPPLASRRKQ